MWSKLSFVAFVGILSLGVSLPSEEECKDPANTPMYTGCNSCSEMYICGKSINPYLVTCAGGTYCLLQEEGHAECVEQLPAGCTPNPPPQPNNPSPSLLCTGSGFYPDPFDCTGFHYCSEYGQRSQFQSCPADYSFDPDFKSTPCKKVFDPAAGCTEVDCSQTSVFKSYGTSNRFYAYCRTNVDPPVVSMFRCTDGTSFDGSRCVFQCQGEGNFANTLNDSTYYQCYYSGEVLVNRLLSCPGSRKFDETLQVCV